MSSGVQTGHDLSMNASVRTAHVNLLAALADEAPATDADDAPPEARNERRPHWPPYSETADRRPSAYLAFRDADHLTSYLRARADLAANVS